VFFIKIMKSFSSMNEISKSEARTVLKAPAANKYKSPKHKILDKVIEEF